MSTRNININSGDSGDNPKLSLRKPEVSTTAITAIVVIAVAALAYLVAWFLAVNITNFYCWSKGQTTCIASDIIHYLFILGVIGGFIGIGAYAVEIIRNTKYLYFRGVFLDRKSIEENAQSLIGVINTSARSEATYGLDTLSKSVEVVGGKRAEDEIDSILATGSVLDDIGRARKK